MLAPEEYYLRQYQREYDAAMDAQDALAKLRQELAHDLADAYAAGNQSVINELDDYLCSNDPSDMINRLRAAASEGGNAMRVAWQAVILLAAESVVERRDRDMIDRVRREFGL